MNMPLQSKFIYLKSVCLMYYAYLVQCMHALSNTVYTVIWNASQINPADLVVLQLIWIFLVWFHTQIQGVNGVAVNATVKVDKHQ